MAIKERCSAQIFKSEIGSPPQKKKTKMDGWRSKTRYRKRNRKEKIV